MHVAVGNAHQPGGHTGLVDLNGVCVRPRRPGGGPELMGKLGELDGMIEAQEKRARRSGLSKKSRENIQKRIGEFRSQQADCVKQFHLKPKEIMKIGRKIKGLKRRIATARDEIDRVEREVGFAREEVHRMAVQIRRTASAATRLGVEKDIILDAERRLEPIDQDSLDIPLVDHRIYLIEERQEEVLGKRLISPDDVNPGAFVFRIGSKIKLLQLVLDRKA